MKKTLIALALVALPVVASADVVLYGNIRAGVELEHYKGPKVVIVKDTSNPPKYSYKVDKHWSSSTSTQIGDFGSYIGFKGSEKLGDNLNAIWQVENKVSVAGGGEWGARDSFIGLEGDFGKVRAGKLSTQLNDMGTVDPWEYNSPALGLGVFTRTGERQASVRYDSPEFAGFSANIQYTPRDNAKPADSLTHEDDTNAGIYAGLNYQNSGFFAKYGFGAKAHHLFDPRSSSEHAKTGFVHRLEGGYDANNLFVGLGLQYTKNWDSLATYAENFVPAAIGQKAKDELKDDAEKALQELNTGVLEKLTENGIRTTELAVTAAYTVGNVTPRVSYAHGWAPRFGNDKVDQLKYDQVVAGADYAFSKRTTALVSAGWLQRGTGDYKSTITAAMVGLRHKF